MKIKSLIAAPDLQNGVWVSFDGEGCEFYLASATRPEFQKALDMARAKYTGFQLKKDDTAQNIFRQAVCEACVLDWKGLEDDNGPMPCTPENKVRVMKDVPVLREWITQQVHDITNFQREAVAEDAETLKSGDGVGYGVGAPEAGA